MNYWLHPQAVEDLEEGALYLASHVSSRVADEFLAEFERVIEILLSNPMLGTPLGGDFREYQFTGFSYSLFYATGDDRGPHIYAVAHQSRDPGYWAWRS